MKEEEKKLITRKKYPGRIAQGNKLAALMKKIKEEILRNKEQSTEQSSVWSSIQSTVQPTVQPAVQSTVHSNYTYVYGIGMLTVLAIGVCIFFAYSTFQPKIKKLINDHSTAQHEKKKRSTTKTTSYALDPI